MVERIGNTIRQFIKELGINRHIQKYQALMMWPEIVGKRISEVTEPQRLTDGKIFVKVKNDSWRNELVFQKLEIINKINGQFGSVVVEDIIFL